MIKEVEHFTIKAVEDLYKVTPEFSSIQVQKTRREHQGDYTLVVFPLLRYSKKTPEQTSDEIGAYLKNNFNDIFETYTVKGFLNIEIRLDFWIRFFDEKLTDADFGFKLKEKSPPIVLEYSSPNTNKPLHLGHIRNNLLGYSIAQILKANGKNVISVNLVNDRGIHICKSMLAWMNWGNGETPESSGLKGDHLVGKYYVLFDQKHKEQIRELVHKGVTESDAYQQAMLYEEAKELLRKWENADEDVLAVWHAMNNWAYKGFGETYKRLGVDFDVINYESKVYMKGKELVSEGLESGAFVKHRDGSVWVDLTDQGLDEKLLLRADGTSVYITQDIGTAQRRFDDYAPQEMIYVVGNEQIYHFEVLKKTLKKLGKPWFDKIHHLSYGMVELPDGKMKSREGTVVDADDLMDEMFNSARKITQELGKSDDMKEEEQNKLYRSISMGALKYFMLKVDPKKNMLFNPEESIDFNGNTGPFIQYTYARIQSILRKADVTVEDLISSFNSVEYAINNSEKELIKTIYDFPAIVSLAAENFSPAMIANFCFDLVKQFNQYYQNTPILKGAELNESRFRILLSWMIGEIIRKSMSLLGIVVPEKM